MRHIKPGQIFTKKAKEGLDRAGVLAQFTQELPTDYKFMKNLHQYGTPLNLYGTQSLGENRGNIESKDYFGGSLAYSVKGSRVKHNNIGSLLERYPEATNAEKATISGKFKFNKTFTQIKLLEKIYTFIHGNEKHPLDLLREYNPELFTGTYEIPSLDNFTIKDYHKVYLMLHYNILNKQLNWGKYRDGEVKDARVGEHYTNAIMNISTKVMYTKEEQLDYILQLKTATDYWNRIAPSVDVTTNFIFNSHIRPILIDLVKAKKVIELSDIPFEIENYSGHLLINHNIRITDWNSIIGSKSALTNKTFKQASLLSLRHHNMKSGGSMVDKKDTFILVDTGTGLITTHDIVLDTQDQVWFDMILHNEDYETVSEDMSDNKEQKRIDKIRSKIKEN